MPPIFKPAEALTLPLIVLGGVAAFPAIPINFEITDDASLAAAAAANATDSFVMLVSLTEPKDNTQYTESDLYRVGTVAKIKQAVKSPDGMMRIVCEGYARAFQVLCNVKGIPSVIVDGQAKSSLNGNWEGHMWNFVQVDGSWYAVDVTWNDPFVPSKPTQKKSGMETRYWMLLGGETMVSTGLSFLASHVGTNQVRPQGLSFTNGPALNRTAYDTSAMLMYSIGGKVTSVGTGMTTVQLWRGNNLKISWNLTGSSAAYNFEGVQAGIYQVTASKADHVTRTQEVVVTDHAMTCDMKLCLLGDVNGDGRLNMGDVAQIYGHSKGVALITDAYILQCADVTGDGRVNVADSGRLSAMIRE